MIRSRMSFGGFQNLTRLIPSINGNPATCQRVNPHSQYNMAHEVAEFLDGPDGDSFYCVDVHWFPVYTSNPNSPNAKWSTSTPVGELKQTIGNVHAVENILEMIQRAKGSEGRKSDKWSTCEFYVDAYPAPAED